MNTEKTKVDVAKKISKIVGESLIESYQEEEGYDKKEAVECMKGDCLSVADQILSMLHDDRVIDARVLLISKWNWEEAEVDELFEWLK